MSRPDLNQLVTLEVLLAEGNVARAAKRLHLSPSAMSRALSRLRESLGDPLLVRAGRGLVPTPRALELRDAIGPLVEQAVAALRPARQPELEQLNRTFTIRCSEGFAENFGPALIERVAAQAPQVRLHFLPKLNKESHLLRDGSVDLETGVPGQNASPEIRVQALFRDRFVGVVRNGHPLGVGEMSAERYASARHVLVSRLGLDKGALDDALATGGITRNITTVVGGFATALALARATDLVASVPQRHTGNLRAGMHTFALPLASPEITVSLMWHPRMHADPAHQWLRACVRDTCTEQVAEYDV